MSPRSSSMSDLYARLGDVGFPKPYVKDRILPDWWEDQLADDAGNRRLAELAISRTLKIPLHELVEPGAALSLGGATQVRFKRWQDVETDKLAPAVAVARRVFELLLAGARDLPPLRFEGCGAALVRSEILTQNQYVTLPLLLAHAWSCGVPVVHLASLPTGSKRGLDGMAFTVNGRPCIALASARKSPAWLIWHLAHELGHVAHGHVRVEAALDVAIDFASYDTEEIQANAFALDLIYGEGNRGGFKSSRFVTSERLAQDARNLGPMHKIWPPCIVTSYAFNMQRAWPAANKALAILNIAEGGPETIRTALAERVDLDQFGETDRHFFVNATGLAE